MALVAWADFVGPGPLAHPLRMRCLFFRVHEFILCCQTLQIVIAFKGERPPLRLWVDRGEVKAPLKLMELHLFQIC